MMMGSAHAGLGSLAHGTNDATLREEGSFSIWRPYVRAGPCFITLEIIASATIGEEMLASRYFELRQEMSHSPVAGRPLVCVAAESKKITQRLANDTTRLVSGLKRNASHGIEAAGVKMRSVARSGH